ncbi:MAG TPA: glutathione S-transferase family protein [Rhizomicrobium sp.]|jgi:glutathione S-transferase|nr:glutathione S-transferase family protein [Rhizomicrobium sp.]
MTLKLYYHPLSSFCWKALVALYENDTPFEPVLVDLGDAAERAKFLALWPVGKFPVLQDTARDRLVPESSIIVEYLAQHYPGRSKLVPDDADMARQVRLRDRFFDLNVQVPMQKITGDRRRPAGQNDPFGVAQARADLVTACGLVERGMGARHWVMGEAFTMADCAALPALFYADKVMPLAKDFPNAAAYLRRLSERPSAARTLKEAAPYFHLFPSET